MSAIQSADGVVFEAQVPVVVIGAGAAGLCAALAASEVGADVVVVERDAVPAGSTALSAGLIPAAGTRFQRAKGIEDDPALFAADVMRKAKNKPDPKIVTAVTQGAGPLVEWLADAHGFPFEVIADFNYPVHSALRMHGLPSRSGAELIDRLRNAVEARGIPILCNSPVETLFADAGGRIHGIEIARADGTRERIGCNALVLACNGYGGNRELVRKFIPEMADALYFGHAGNRGDAVLWGERLKAATNSLSGYQGHGSVAMPHNILVTWAVIMEGGVQVNMTGRRFSNEALGYSEQAADVLKQPDGIAFSVFDARIAGIARQFQDFQNAERAGALLTAQSSRELAEKMRIPVAAFAAEMEDVAALARGGKVDRFGRDFSNVKPLIAPLHAIKVTGALFHTQGGLSVDAHGRVLREDGATFPNLFAAGGAAAGVSGPEASGYLSGNGLLTATTLGRNAGAGAAQISMAAARDTGVA
jgi:fumarate reductase flavoprotein subunit